MGLPVEMQGMGHCEYCEWVSIMTAVVTQVVPTPKANACPFSKSVTQHIRSLQSKYYISVTTMMLYMYIGLQ
jgi:hypothetical protein